MATDQQIGQERAWPPVAYEERAWEPTEAPSVSRRARLAHLGPYRAAVPPQIAPIIAIPMDGDTLALVDEASREIARFDAELGAQVAPFTSLLLRSESAASSKIENLTASAKAIALAELGDPRGRNANVIVANTNAMEAAIALADRLDEQAIFDMHETLLGSTHPEWVGHWRDAQVWIGGSDFGPHRAAFVPPHHERVPDAMADLIGFMRRDDLVPLAQAAIAHAQFETIHPFPDGNGRTGRSLIHSLLRAKQVTRSVTVPVSAGLLTDTEGYFGALTTYREGEPADLLLRFGNASFLAIDNARRLVSDLRDVRDGWPDRIRARSDSSAWGLADLLMRQPVVDSRLVQRELGVSATNVNNAIERLVDADVLRKVSGQYRNRKWAAHEVLATLDAFAERAGRRSR